MMKRFNLRHSHTALLGAGLLSMAMVGCGSDGNDGEDGKDGVVGVNINSTSTLKANFTKATVDNGKVTVDFTLENANGVAVLGLTKEHDLRFGIAQLAHVTETMPDKEGNEVEYDRGFQWQAYINSKKEPNPDWVPEGDPDIHPSTQFQAGVEKASDCDECLVDNGDGSYSYTYQVDIAQVTEPLAIAYNGDYTQRATLELELPQVVTNAHYDWQPSSGMTDGIQTRDVVSIESCYTCHQPDSLALHGGRRIDLENCASCHTPTSGDPESGNSVDWTYMIHAIHKGEDRKTYAPEDPNADEEGKIPAPYKVVGYGGSTHDYGKVMYPQKPAADCAACHVEGEGAPADAALFKADKSNEACIACHTTVPKAYHKADNRNCISCHVAEGYARSAEEAHGDATKSYKASLGYSAKFTNVKAENGALTFDVQILDDKGQPVAKEYIANPSAYTKSSIYFSWDIDKDYPAYAEGSKYSNRGYALLDDKVSAYNADTKTFSINSTANGTVLPELDGKSVELYAGVATCFREGGYGRPVVEPVPCDTTDDYGNSVTSYAYIQDEPLRFTWNGNNTTEAATARRSIIDAGKCQGCHNQEIVHYDNGVNCQACHTPDKGLSYGAVKEPTSFAYKAHHADGHYLKYAGAGTGTVIKTDCATCHADNGIQLGRATDRAWRYADAEGKDLWVSSDAGSCLSCHQKYLSDAGKAHIESFGGYMGPVEADAKAASAVESCSTCHNPTQINQLHGN